MAQFKKKVMIGILAIVLILFVSSLLQCMDSGHFQFYESVVYAAEKNQTEPAENEKVKEMRDPLEPVNRVFFQFNDKLYFWVLKPVSKVYSFILPSFLRTGIRNGFHNLLVPVRFVNNLLQGKPKNAGIEVARFAINTTVGIGGLMDVAKHEFNLYPKNEDFGQTLGKYGIGPGIYIDWPIFGPSSIRDTVGMAGDFFLDPIFYLSPDIETTGAIFAGKYTNNTSLRLGEYEDFKESAIDPYIALRNAYYQHRIKEIRE